METQNIDLKELRKLFAKFLRTLNNTNEDEWYATDRYIADFTFKQFLKWLKEQSK